MKSITSLLHTLAAGSMALLASVAQAEISTTTLTGWTTFGDVVSQAGAISLTTANADFELGNLSGTSALYISHIADAAGVYGDVLNPPGSEYGLEGSLVTQSFSVAAGQTLSFDWSFSSTDAYYLDHAFAIINGQVFTLATSSQPGGASQSFLHSFSQAGTVSLAFGVIDTEDFEGVSTLSISNLQVSAVPEPSTYALLLAGLGVVAVGARRRQGR